MVLLDLYSRQAVGWQMSTRIDRKVVCDALHNAIITRGKPEGVMVHSDQGSQYASKDYRALITQYKLTQIMSRRVNCWDNAVAESLFATLKKQAILWCTFFNQARGATAYI
ncbi:MAG: DDE-type integrase/transposase/recombinase [Methylophilaceae bacterium]|nr:MAG: DDE-type integrase/transposase/recombinase [Methylophilaceae bacterium]